jgi:hypothetical protein
LEFTVRNDIVWYPRLAAIPGFEDEGDTGIARSNLEGHDAVPRVNSYQILDRDRQESLIWPTPTGSTSASPARQHAFPALHDSAAPAQTILRQFTEAIELPGIASDYHFIIQSGIEALSRPQHRKSDPALVATVERWCWINVRLIETHPDIISFENNGDTRFARALAFGHLIDLYEREGFLHEALAIAERASRCGQGDAAIERLRERIKQLEAEDAV